MKKETFKFDTAASLKRFLNQFKDTDLEAVFINQDTSGFLSLSVEVSKLSDGSEITDFTVEG
jgi:hypothetical protein